MNFEVRATKYFLQQAKKLSKRHASLKQDLAVLIDELAENPLQGTALGKDCFKIRLAISSKGKGKSGGARVITNVKIIGKKVFLMDIYDKTDLDNISDKKLENLINNLPE